MNIAPRKFLVARSCLEAKLYDWVPRASGDDPFVEFVNALPSDREVVIDLQLMKEVDITTLVFFMAGICPLEMREIALEWLQNLHAPWTYGDAKAAEKRRLWTILLAEMAEQINKGQWYALILNFQIRARWYFGQALDTSGLRFEILELLS